MNKRILLEITVKDDGRFFLPRTSFSVEAKPIGSPKLVEFLDDNTNDENIFVRKRNCIHAFAPDKANSYSIDNSRESLEATKLDLGGDDESIMYRLAVQYYEIDKKSLIKAIEGSYKQ